MGRIVPAWARWHTGQMGPIDRLLLWLQKNEIAWIVFLTAGIILTLWMALGR